MLPGNGELRGPSQERVRALGLSEAFRTPGLRGDVGSLISLFSVGCVRSMDGEGSGTSVKEPMALGIPVAASDLPGNLEVLGAGGLPFRNRDPEALAAILARLLGDGGLLAELGARARERAEGLSVGGMASGVLSAHRGIRR